jgi:predicted nucleic acid-binding protein
MVIVDTSVLIDFLMAKANPQSLWLKEQVDSRRIAITTLIQCEVLQGIRVDRQFAEAAEVLNQFEIFETGSKELALASARNYRALHKVGITVRSTIDSLIATFCIEEQHVLLHNDRDFDAFETHLGLKVLHPPESAFH